MAIGDSLEEMPRPLQTEKVQHEAIDTQTAAGIVDTSAADGNIDEYPNVFRRTCIVLGVALSIFLLGLDLTIVAVAIPRITDDFKGIDLAGWYGSSFFVTLAASQPAWGKSYQSFSLKYAFMAAIFIFELGSLISGVAPTSTVLIIGRAISGIGGAGIASGGYAILGVIVEPHLRPIFTGLVTTTYSVASMLGPIVGGLFAEHVTWRWCFYVNLPIGAVSALVIVTLFKVPLSVRPPDMPLKEKLLQLDLIGTLLALASLCCLFRGLQIAGITKAWNSAETIGMLVSFVVLTALFVISQWFQKDRAMLVPKLLKKRVVAIGMAYGFFHEGSVFLILYYIPIHFQAVTGASPSEAGVRNLPLLLSCGLSSVATGYLVSRFGHFVPLMILGSACGSLGSGLFIILDANSPAWQWIVFQLIAGFGFGIGFPLAIISGQATVEMQELASTTAMVLFSANVGVATAISLGLSVFDNLILTRLASTIPDINSSDVLHTGAAELRTSFPSSVQGSITEAYSYSLRAVFALAVAYAGIAVVVSFGSSWRPLEIKKGVKRRNN